MPFKLRWTPVNHDTTLSKANPKATAPRINTMISNMAVYSRIPVFSTSPRNVIRPHRLPISPPIGLITSLTPPLTVRRANDSERLALIWLAHEHLEFNRLTRRVEKFSGAFACHPIDPQAKFVARRNAIEMNQILAACRLYTACSSGRQSEVFGGLVVGADANNVSHPLFCSRAIENCFARMGTACDDTRKANE